VPVEAGRQGWKQEPMTPAVGRTAHESGSATLRSCSLLRCPA
jgi:hypothetical protein